MGDISMRGKGRALKMQSGGSTTERRKKERENKIEKMFGPKTKRPGPTIKPLIPKPVKPMPRDPKKVPEFESMPRPRPLPRDLRDLEKLKGAKIIKPSGRINMDDLFNADKYKIKKPKRAPMQTKDPMQAKPLPMTPELIKKAKDRMVPNPRAQQRDRSEPIIGKPMRRSSARIK
jgi:hypothetical protein